MPLASWAAAVLLPLASCWLRGAFQAGRRRVLRDEPSGRRRFAAWSWAAIAALPLASCCGLAAGRRRCCCRWQVAGCEAPFKPGGGELPLSRAAVERVAGERSSVSQPFLKKKTALSLSLLPLVCRCCLLPLLLQPRTSVSVAAADCTTTIATTTASSTPPATTTT